MTQGRAAKRFADYEIPDLYAALEGLLRQIPRGCVSTYGALARALGDVKAAKWVAEELITHEHTTRCRCHRVIRMTGELGLYSRGRDGGKAERLAAEGVHVTGGLSDLERYGVAEFKSDKPLERLSDIQRSLPKRIRLKPWPEIPPVVGGVDVSYAGGVASAAYVEVATDTGELLWSTTLLRPTEFPYISGYLAFREIGVLLAVIEAAREAGRLAPLVFVDGSGILHDRGAGSAAHLGVLADHPTIGVSKKQLCGAVDLEGLPARDPRPILHEGRVAGVALRAESDSRPIFVSPGQHIDVESASRAAVKLFHGHRLPEPIYHADRLSRAACRGGVEGQGSRV